MKIKSLRIKNFRGYCDSGIIRFDSLTAFIGKNDAGKSTVLEALEVFFDPKKMDKGDVNVVCRKNGNVQTVLDVCFENLPAEIDIDAGGKTTLANEYLLNAEGCLEVVVCFTDGAKPKTYVRACHPANPDCGDLLKKKNADLKKIVEKYKLACDKSSNAAMRRAIWDSLGDGLLLENQDLEVESKDGEMKAIWGKLRDCLPVYSLFRSDRSNDDGDTEVQDPLKQAVKEVVKREGLQTQLEAIARTVNEKLEEVAQRTLAKVNEMAPNIAESLHPNLPRPKWEDLFKGVSITSDQDVPLAKRGSGVRRLILLNFFRAEVERKKIERNAPDVIYAIEEPETSQHANFQIQLVEALVKMAMLPSVQIIITTHSSTIVRILDAARLRIVVKSSDDTSVKEVDDDGMVLPVVSLHEICYLAYGHEASVEYHDELYGCLWLREKAVWDKQPHGKNDRFNEEAFEKALMGLGLRFSKSWKRESKKQAYPCTLQTYIRNKIHHPENQENNGVFNTDDLRQSIDEMRSLLLG